VKTAGQMPTLHHSFELQALSHYHMAPEKDLKTTPVNPQQILLLEYAILLRLHTVIIRTLDPLGRAQRKEHL